MISLLKKHFGRMPIIYFQIYTVFRLDLIVFKLDKNQIIGKKIENWHADYNNQRTTHSNNQPSASIRLRCFGTFGLHSVPRRTSNVSLILSISWFLLLQVVRWVYFSTAPSYNNRRVSWGDVRAS